MEYTMNFSKTIKTFQLTITLLLIVFSSHTWATDFRLFVGEIKTLVIKTPIERVAVGNGSLVSTSILDNGNLLVLAEEEGDTELQIWLENGKVIAHKFYIVKNNTSRDTAEIKKILGELPNAEVSEVGQNIVIKGNVSNGQSAVITKLIDIYPQIVNLSQPTSDNELEDIFSSIPYITMTRAGSKVILRGDVTAENKDFIAAVQQSYLDIVDLTAAPSVAVKPMVYMNVQITEFSTNALQNLGINWTNTFNGPSAGFAQNFDSRRGVVLLIIIPLALHSQTLRA